MSRKKRHVYWLCVSNKCYLLMARKSVRHFEPVWREWYNRIKQVDESLLNKDITLDEIRSVTVGSNIYMEKAIDAYYYWRNYCVFKICILRNCPESSISSIPRDVALYICSFCII